MREKVINQRNNDYNNYVEEVNYFLENCQRLGVELKHDAEQLERKKQEEKNTKGLQKTQFSAISTMMKMYY